MIPLGLVPALRRGLQQPGQEPATAPADLSGTIGEPPPGEVAQALAALAAMGAAQPEGDSLPPIDPAIAGALPEGFAEAAAAIEPEELETVPDPGLGRRLASIFLASLGEALGGQPGMGSQLIQQQRILQP
jgi:hypothetical protein